MNLWTPKSFTNWSRIHKISNAPQGLKIPDNINLIHDITKYGYTEESQISTQTGIVLTSPAATGFYTSNTGWNNRAHNFVYHMALRIGAGADADADARCVFMVYVPDISGTTSTNIPLSEQLIIPKVTSEESYVGFTLPMPFVFQPNWYPSIFWNGALAASQATLYVVHIESEE